MVGATVSNALHDVSVVCTPEELSIIQPPTGNGLLFWGLIPGLSCGAYLGPFLESPANVGQLLNPNATSNCEYCRFAEGDAYLATLNMYWSQRWRNFGIFCAYDDPLFFLVNRLRYIIFNFFGIFVLFYLTRIAKRERRKPEKRSIFTSAKELALRVGKAFEDNFIRKSEGETIKQGMDHVMNSANFAVFQGVGLETFDSRGLGRQWTRREDEPLD